jgi:16S rRNA (guanine(527)-N(7))-methyltransferase RsmG
MTDQDPLVLDRAELLREFDSDDRLREYIALLLEENRRHNLVSRETDEAGLLDLALESLMPLKYITVDSTASYLDVGSGGGLPAVPLLLHAPFYSSLKLPPVLVERREKKSGALRRICIGLGLRVHIVNEPMEQANFRHRFDLVTMRLVKPTKELLTKLHSVISDSGKIVYFGNLNESVAPTGMRIELQAYRLTQQNTERHLTILENLQK